MIRALALGLVLWLGVAGAAVADPVFTPIALAIATSLPFVAAAVDTIVFFAVQAALYAGTTWAITRLTAPSQRAAGQERQASVLQISLGEGPRELLVGEAATGGQLLDAFNYGGTYGTDWEVLVIALADHRCEALVGYYIGDSYYAFAGGGPQAGFNGQLAISFHDGAPGQTADADLISDSAGRWTSDDRLAGMAYVVVKYKADDPKAANPVWPTGRPQFVWRVKGARFYDPRLDPAVAGGDPGGTHAWDDPSTWAWTENPILARYGYVRGLYAEDQVDDPTALRIGRGLTAEEAPPERVIAAANLCDEAVALKAGGTEPRYTVGGVIRADEPFDQVDEMFAAATAGVIVQREGGLEIEPGAAKSAVAAIADADLLVGFPIRVESFVSDLDRVNTVTPRYIDPAQIWRETAAPVRRSTADLVADGGLRERSLSLGLVTRQTQAQRCGEIERRLARKERRASVTLGPRFSHLEEGDWITWTSDRYFSGGTVTFRIEAHSEDAGLRTGLILREIAASCFAWTAAEDEGTPGQAPVDEPGDLDALELAGVAFEAFALVGDDGTETPGIRATWTTPVDLAVHAVRLEVRRVGEVEAAHARCDAPNAGEFVTSSGVPAAAAVEARLIPISTEGRRVTPSAWLPVTTGGYSLPDLLAALGDGVLTPGEKLAAVPTIEALVAARAALRAQADDLDLTVAEGNAERIAYENAATAVDAILAVLTAPVAWNDRSGRTTIADPAAFVAAISGSLEAERNLQSAVAAASKVLIDTALSDGVLTPSEKRSIIPMINALVAARTGLRARADALLLTVGAGNAERIAYETAATNLDAYLATLTSPVAWNVSTDNTTIAAPATFKTRLEDAQKTERNLQSKIDGVAAETMAGPGGALLTYQDVHNALIKLPSKNLWRKVDWAAVGAAASAVTPAFGVSGWGVQFAGGAGDGQASVSGKTFGLAASGAAYSLGFDAKLTAGGGTATVRAGWRTSGGAAISDVPDVTFTVTTAQQRFIWENVSSADPNFVTSIFKVFEASGDVAGGKTVQVTDLQMEYGSKATTAWRPSPDDVELLRYAGYVGELAATVGGTFGTDLKETGGGATATLANFKTALGTALFIANQAAAATDPTIQPGSTKNTLYLQGSAPGSPGNGDLWGDTSTSPNLWKIRIAGAWQTAASLGAVLGSSLYETLGGALATLANFKTSLGTAAFIVNQGAWATEAALTPTIVNGRTQYYATDGKFYDYRGAMYGYATNGVVGRAGDPLTSTSSSVSVAAHNVYFPLGTGGNVTVSIPATSVSGMPADTTITVFYRPDFNDWSFQAPANTPPYYTSRDGWMFVGQVRTAVTGTTYNPPPYSSGGAVEWCVAADAWLAPGARAGDARVGDPLTLMTPSGEGVYAGAIEAVSRATADCLRLETTLGAALTVSESAPIITVSAAGGLPYAVRAADCRPGLPIPVDLGDGEVTWDRIATIALVGPRAVARISAGDGVFAAGDEAGGARIFTHNAYAKP